MWTLIVSFTKIKERDEKSSFKPCAHFASDFVHSPCIYQSCNRNLTMSVNVPAMKHQGDIKGLEISVAVTETRPLAGIIEIEIQVGHG